MTAVPDGVRAPSAGGVVRLLAPADVGDVFQRLSDRDTYVRIFGPTQDFRPTITRLDPTQVALGAYQSDVLVGVAHYETFADAQAAEIGLVVDGVRARGLGTLLLAHLASVARHRGVRRFVAEVPARHRRMIHVVADAGLTYRTRTDGAIVILLTPARTAAMSAVAT